MAAPAAALRASLGFRDAKGQMSHMRVLVGDADAGTIITDIGTLVTHVQAASNAHVTTNLDSTPPFTYGASAEYDTVEDKMQLVFRGSAGTLHRFLLAAPKAAGFAADGETVLKTQAQVAAVITDFTTFCYGSPQDTSPLVYVGGIRVRRGFQRKFNIWTKNPALADEGE